jgi:hypothetical protein
MTQENQTETSEQTSNQDYYRFLDSFGIRNIVDLVRLPKGAIMELPHIVRRDQITKGKLEGISFNYYRDNVPYRAVDRNIRRHEAYLPLEFNFQGLPPHVRAENLEGDGGYWNSTSQKIYIPLFYAVEALKVIIKTESGELMELTKTTDLERLSATDDKKGE